MDNGGAPQYRGSNRAMKMLQAQLQKTNSQQAANRKSVDRPPVWPPRNNSISSLEPTDSIHIEKPIATVATSTVVQRVNSIRQTGNVVTTPIARRAVTSYASPEASIPSNGGVPLCDNSFGFRDLDASMASQTSNLLGSSAALANDFNNNSNTGFTVPSPAKTTQIMTTQNENHKNTISSNHNMEEINNNDDLYHVNSESETRSNMCFSLGDGKVTSLVSTADGAYCIAGFSSGAIRLFDLTTEGNTDPEDRFGYQIGMIESSRGSVQVQLQLGTAVSGVGGSTVNCCHLFAGARQGSTTMLVVDIGFLRDVHKKRGFITVAGGGVQVLTHVDVRLKGLTALHTVSAYAPGSSNRSSSESATSPGMGSSRGYVTTYRLITGRGFGNYHIWEVTLDARVVHGIGSPSAGGGGGVLSSSTSALSYKQVWTHLYQGNVNGSMMGFAHFVHRQLPWAPSELTSTATVTNTNLSFWEQCQQRALLDRNLVVKEQEQMELLACDVQKDLRIVRLLSEHTDTSAETNPVKVLTTPVKPATLKGTTNTYACSQNGRILFGGKYELIVSILDTTTTQTTTETTLSSDPTATPLLSISYRAIFSLSDFVAGAVGPSSKKTSRHLREISEVWCTPDGAYALIHCTDNAVLLYSVCDITGKSSFPTRTDGTAQGYYISQQGGSSSSSSSTSVPAANSGGGFLTFLFEVDEAFHMDLGISYCIPESERAVPCTSKLTYGSHPSCACGIHSLLPELPGRQLHHLPAEYVQISAAWWLVENPMLAGVLKVSRLKIPVTAVGPSSKHNIPVLGEISEHLIPTAISTSTLVLAAVADKASSSTTGGRRSSSSTVSRSNTCCTLCGDTTTKHWADEDISETEKSLCAEHGTWLPLCSPSSGAPPRASDTTHRSSGHEKEKKTHTAVKKRELRRESSESTTSVRPPTRDKRQKTTHSSTPDSNTAGSGLSHNDNRSEGDSFVSYDSDAGLSEDTSRSSLPASTAPSQPTTTSIRADRTSPNQPPGHASPMHSASDDDSDNQPVRRNRHTNTTAGVVTAAAEDNRIDDGIAAAAGTADMNVKELRQELERVRAENRRLRIDTDLTMRKADRRFELEMVARRYWKKEKTDLEAVISVLQKDLQRWNAEKDKMRRLHSVLQSVLCTTSAALDSSLEEPADISAANRQRIQNSTAMVSHNTSTSSTTAGAAILSPSSHLRNELTAVGKGEKTVTFASRDTSSSSSSNTGQLVVSNNGNNGRRSFFCIVCLEHTAKVAIQPCGHIVLCVAHAEEMQQRACNGDHHYSKCPVCQVKVVNFLTLQGIEN